MREVIGVSLLAWMAAAPAAAAEASCRSTADCGEDQACFLRPGCGQPQGECLGAPFVPEMALCGCDGTSRMGRPDQPYRATGPCPGDTAFVNRTLGGPQVAPPDLLPLLPQEPQPPRRPERAVQVTPRTACERQVIELRPLPGGTFADLPEASSAFFAPCGLEGRIVERAPDRLQVEVPEGAQSGCVWIGDARTRRERDTRAALIDECSAAKGKAVTKKGGQCSAGCSQVCARGPNGAWLGRVEVLRPPRIRRFQVRGAWPEPEEPSTAGKLQQVMPGSGTVTLEWGVDSAGPGTSATLQRAGQETAVALVGARSVRPSSGEVLVLTAKNACGADRRELELRAGPSLAFRTPQVRLGPGDSVEVPLRLDAPARQAVTVELSASSPEIEVPGQLTLQRGAREAKVKVKWKAPVLGARAPAAAKVTARAAPSEATLDVQLERTLLGFADIHSHQFANLGFGGAFIGDPIGALSQLGSCQTAHGLGGWADVTSAVLQARLGHDTTGWTAFRGWPTWDTFTHQTVHQDWLERAWRGGLRLMVMLSVNNELVCRTFHLTQPLHPGARQLSCSDADAVARQLAAAQALQDRIDRQAGGPGRGWYRIVRTPEEARRVIQNGQLAVVLGVEVDFLFDCRHPLSSGHHCSKDEVTAQLEALHKRGVRHVFPVHLATNGFSGAALYNPLVTAAGHGSKALERCADPSYRYDKYLGIRRGYPVCNTQGLTDLGKHLVNELMRLGMIVDVNHMSARAFEDTMALVRGDGQGRKDYPIVGSHSGFVEQNRDEGRHEGNFTVAQLEKVRAVRGMIGVITSQHDVDSLRPECGQTSLAFAEAYRYALRQSPDVPVALGADFNGFAGEPAPLWLQCAPAGQPVKPVTYPFLLPVQGAQWLDGDVSGARRPYHMSADGLSHAGLLPDLVQELRANGVTDEELAPLFQSAMGYVETWERAEAARRP